MPKNSLSTSTQIYEFSERITNLLRAEAWKVSAAYDLQPIQLQMLHYLSICNRYSNTPIAVSDYFQLTKGTVSQSLKVLEARGYIEKRPNHKDGRSVHLCLSPTGAALLAHHWPPSLLHNACQLLPDDGQEQIRQALQTLLSKLQEANKQQRFGVCVTCRYQQQAEENYRCGLTGEVLIPHEIELICREHEPHHNPIEAIPA
jgi:DNA-binding MarR family transcriptional regulator